MNKTITLLFTLTALACGPLDDGVAPPPVYEVEATEEDPSAELYDERNFPRFDLEIGPAALESLRRNPRKNVRATLRYRGVVLSDIAVRLKGEYSFRPIDQKPSFRIKLDQFVPQRLHGKTRLVFNNAMQDPSFLSERLSYAVYRAAGHPAPRANSAMVFVNGDYYGLYTNVEAVDKTFLRRWFASPKGNLYEEAGADFVRGAEKIFELDTNEEQNDRRDLAALIAALDRATPATFLQEVSPHLDILRFVRYCALEAAVGHTDGYAFREGLRNNFRLYNDPASGAFTFIAAGMDRTLRPLTPPSLVHEWVPRGPTYGSPVAAHGVVLKKCLASAECRALYVGAVANVARILDEQNLPAAIEAGGAQIRAAVRADRRKELDDDLFERALGTMRGYVGGRASSLRASMAAGVRQGSPGGR